MSSDTLSVFGVFPSGVNELAGVQGKQDEVKGGESGSSEVCSAISPSSVVHAELRNHGIDGLVDDSLASVVG